ncbi:hypothetical protein KMP11_01170 [Gemella sp. zg-570]|nr:hypothetical protein [Gemella sp. zg-1178]QWQ39499.1 hypothetical protein KMP11_01170 [Gemella sp. zg-570]
MNDYKHIIDYDFSKLDLKDTVAVSFKIKNNITAYDFLTIFYEKKGKRFAIKRPNAKDMIIGIGHEYTWNFDSNDFLTNYKNDTITSDFENLMSQTSKINIDDFSNDYFGMYGGVSAGNNKKSQEWIDFSDTIFVIPSILAVFKDEEILFTLFFKNKKDVDFSKQWQDRIVFLRKIANKEFIPLRLIQPKSVREIYPEVWQDNIKEALEQIENNIFKRIALSRKNQIVLDEEISLAKIVKYFTKKKLYFIAFESKKSSFITSNPLLSLSTSQEELKAYLYLQKENLFNGRRSIDFDEEDIEKNYKKELEEKTGYTFEIFKDKILTGKALDIYSVCRTKGNKPLKDIKLLSLLYPISIIKGYPKEETEKFLKERENIGYGFWYSPFGFINHNLEANFYTCGNMIVSFKKIITIFTTILVNDLMTYEDIIENSDDLVAKNLKLFDNKDLEGND